MKELSAKIILGLFFLVALLQAHSPAGISAEYDTLDQTLKITVEHNVKNPGTHYVKRIEIYVGKNKKIEQLSTRQVDDASQSYIFKLIDVAMGDTLNITASCNIVGNKKSKFIFAPGILKPPEE